MVAATNSSANNVLMKGISTTPAASVNGKGANNATPDASTSGDDFTTLLNSLLGDNTDTTTVNTLQKPGAPATEEKDESKADPSIDISQWLLSPLTQANAQPVVTTVSQQDGVETIGALTAGNNAATNILLTQGSKRIGDASGDIDGQKTEPASDDAAALVANGNTDQSILNDLLSKPETVLQTNTMLNAIDTGKNDASSRGDDVNQNTNVMTPTPTSTFQTAINDINNAAPKYEIHSRIGTREWTNDVGNQLTMMVSHKIQSASLQLTPDNLGPVQVKIDINNNQASVWFAADHPDTRTALEQSLPQLRELFTSQGMSLMDAGVFQQSQQQASAFTNHSQPLLGLMDMSGEATQTQQVMKIGLLDTYA